MPVRLILTHPDARLQSIAAPVEPGTPSALALATDLRDTLDAAVGTGIAAPQIGEALRMVFVDPRRNPKYAASALPPSILCNPRIVERCGTQTFREGCLSVPQFTGKTKRAKRIIVCATDEFGAAVELELAGFEAVLVQHEIDHLDGILFLDRLQSRASLMAREQSEA